MTTSNHTNGKEMMEKVRELIKEIEEFIEMAEEEGFEDGAKETTRKQLECLKFCEQQQKKIEDYGIAVKEARTGWNEAHKDCRIMQKLIVFLMNHDLSDHSFKLAEKVISKLSQDYTNESA